MTSVKLYRTDAGVSVATDANDERDFVAAASAALAEVATSPDDLHEFLPHILDIACKLRGYKAPGVLEKRVLISGQGMLPEESLLVQANGRGIVKEPVGGAA